VSGGAPPKESAATKLVGLAVERCELFADLRGKPYATVPVDDHVETVRLRSSAFREYLARVYYLEHGTAPSENALRAAITTLCGKALFEAEPRDVGLRLAEHEGRIYLDLADEHGRVVEIDADGWRLTMSPPVPLWRSPGMLELPVPERGGTLDDLWRVVNLAGDDRLLVVAWLLGALSPRGPYPILDLQGEQGTGKSDGAAILRRLIDPAKPELRARPRDERDLAIAATNTWIVALDNLSSLPEWASDSLCRLATGGGLATRTLYEDEEETLFDVCRPVILTAIGDVATRGDLLDRAIIVRPPYIPPARRRPREEVMAEAEALRPRILGCLLDAVSMALRRMPEVVLDEHPRMADFARLVAAAEPALGWKPGLFLGAYQERIEAAVEIALDGSPIAAPVRSLAERGGFRGTASELLQRLADEAGEDATRRKGWPADGSRLSSELRRIAPSLRRVGVEVTLDVRLSRKNYRGIEIRLADAGADAVPTLADAAPTLADAAASAVKPAWKAEMRENADAADAADAEIHTLSCTLFRGEEEVRKYENSVGTVGTVGADNDFDADIPF
jgi:hypothetical protein